MASAIALTSTTLEGQYLEIVMAMQARESDDTSNPNNENRVTGTINTDTLALNSTGNIAVKLALNAQGKPEFEAVEYLSDPSTGG